MATLRPQTGHLRGVSIFLPESGLSMPTCCVPRCACGSPEGICRGARIGGGGCANLNCPALPAYKARSGYRSCQSRRPRSFQERGMSAHGCSGVLARWRQRCCTPNEVKITRPANFHGSTLPGSGRCATGSSAGAVHGLPPPCHWAPQMLLPGRREAHSPKKTAGKSAEQGPTFILDAIYPRLHRDHSVRLAT